MTVRILLVRSWAHPIAPLRTALAAAGLRARFVRVDIEPAVNAALGRGGFDVIVFDAGAGLSRATLDACIRDHETETPVIELGLVDDLAARITAALRATRN
jgi:hypothetical protein|nr:hypothetical protein [Kofleriaceae bacterium]